jgi:hypothetical protein
MKLHNIQIGMLFLGLLAPGFSFAQDSVARELLLNISYYKPFDNVPYLKITAREKVDRKFIPQPGINGSVYLGEQTESGLLGKIKTNTHGEAFVYIPSAFKAGWDSMSPVKFSVTTEATKIFDATSAEAEITKSKIQIDTSGNEEGKNITITVSSFHDGAWLPAKDVELKVSVKRSLGNLPVGEEESYTNDSTGTITASFTRDSLPGDSQGNLILVARTEDNETFGNIFTEKIVRWGKPPVIENKFNERSLWATRFKTPIWLLALAYSIIGLVWGALIYIIIQVIKIRKLGKMTS